MQVFFNGSMEKKKKQVFILESQFMLYVPLWA